MYTTTILKCIGGCIFFQAMVLPSYGALTSTTLITTNVIEASGITVAQGAQYAITAGVLKASTRLAEVILTPTGTPYITFKCIGGTHPRSVEMRNTAGGVIKAWLSAKVGSAPTSWDPVTPGGWQTTEPMRQPNTFIITSDQEQIIAPGVYSTSCTASVYNK